MHYNFKELNNIRKDSEFVIFSVFKNNVSEWVNIENTMRFRNILFSSGIGYKELEGRYKGTKEISFIISLDDFLTLEHAIFNDMQQESVLILGILLKNTFRTARLRFANGKEIQQGFFKQVSKEKALKNRDYTLDYMTGNYYTTEFTALNIIE